MKKIDVKVRMMAGCEELFPAKAHHDDAAYDLRSRCDMELAVGKSTLVPTGMFLELPVGFEAQVRPRSGLALKHNLSLTNSPGTIDAGYRGEVGVIMFNPGPAPFPIHRGDRIAQMVVARHENVEWVPAESLTDSERGEGGFGHTGRQ